MHAALSSLFLSRRALALALGSVAALAFAGSRCHAAGNLLQNPTFDTDLAAWSPSLGGTAAWNSADEVGNPASGSALAERQLVDFAGFLWIYQCVPVVPGEVYAFGGDGLIPGGTAPESAVQLHTGMRFYPGPNCGGGGAFGSVLGTTTATLRDSWGPLRGTVIAPAGAASAEFQLMLTQGAPITEGAQAFFDNAFVIPGETCGPSPTAMCLGGRRFHVSATWETDGGDAGFGRAVPLTAESGYLWFFGEDNIEIVAKVLDACAAFDRFWFFAAGLTNVQVEIRVTDTAAEETRLYQNPQGTPFQPLQDTSAFATCP